MRRARSKDLLTCKVQLFADGTAIVHMPQHMRLHGDNSSDDSDDEAMVPASGCGPVKHKVHTRGGHKGQERAWKNIAGAYHGISQDLVKAYVKNYLCTSARAGRAARRKRACTAMWAPSAWFRVEADLIDMTDQPSMSEGKVYPTSFRSSTRKRFLHCLRRLKQRLLVKCPNTCTAALRSMAFRRCCTLTMVVSSLALFL